MKFKKIALLPLLALPFFTENANAEAKKESTWGTRLSLSYNILKADFNRDFYSRLNENYSSQIRDYGINPPWKDLKPASYLQLAGYDIDVRLKKSLYFTLGFQQSLPFKFSKYDETYTYTDPFYGLYKDHITRVEDNIFQKYSLGFGIEKSFEKFSLDAKAKADFWRCMGDSKMTRKKGPTSNPEGYIQQKEASYYGEAFGGTIEAKASYYFSRRFSAGLSAGYTFTTLDAEGHETTISSTTSAKIQKDYNPRYKLNGFNIAAQLEILFGGKK